MSTYHHTDFKKFLDTLIFHDVDPITLEELYNCVREQTDSSFFAIEHRIEGFNVIYTPSKDVVYIASDAALKKFLEILESDYANGDIEANSMFYYYTQIRID